MKKDGTLSKAEKATMLKAFDIMNQWCRKHAMDDDETHVDNISEALSLLNVSMHAMLRD